MKKIFAIALLLCLMCTACNKEDTPVLDNSTTVSEPTAVSTPTETQTISETQSVTVTPTEDDKAQVVTLETGESLEDYISYFDEKNGVELKLPFYFDESLTQVEAGKEFISRNGEATVTYKVLENTKNLDMKEYVIENVPDYKKHKIFNLDRMVRITATYDEESYIAMLIFGGDKVYEVKLNFPTSELAVYEGIADTFVINVSFDGTVG